MEIAGKVNCVQFAPIQVDCSNFQTLTKGAIHLEGQFPINVLYYDLHLSDHIQYQHTLSEKFHQQWKNVEQWTPWFWWDAQDTSEKY